MLTNGSLFKPAELARLAAAEARSRYSLELRVSLDGDSPELNDRLRGEGTFSKAMQGIKLLLAHGFLPIVTVAQTWEDGGNDAMFGRFVDALRAAGYDRPRIKIIPTLRLGAEVQRTRGYDATERVTATMLEAFDDSQLLCTHSRMVTSRGVYVCPILIDSPEARLGVSLGEALGPFPLAHGACYTCYVGGALCSNFSSEAADVT